MSSEKVNLPRVNILGVNVSAINMDQAITSIDEWITQRKQNYICVTPAHTVMECQHNPGLMSIFNSSGLTTPDGMSIVWLLKFFGHNHVSRVYGPDLMLAVCAESTKHGYKHFLYGGNFGVADELQKKLSAKFAGIQFVGTHTPPFRPLTPEEDQEVINVINATQPDIIWVGLSSPKQEIWMAEHMGRLDAPVMIGVGAAFDFLSGSKKQAPKWIQNLGFEWLFRLGTEPRRLWRRYMQYPVFIGLVLLQVLGLRKKP